MDFSGLSGLPPKCNRQRIRGGDRPVVGQIHDRGIVDRRDVEGVLLPGRGCTEAGLDAGSKGKIVGKAETAGELPVRGHAEVGEVLDALRKSQRPVPGAIVDLQIGVDREIVPVPHALGQRPEPREAIGARSEPLAGERAFRPRLFAPLHDLEALVPELGAARQVDPAVECIGEIQIQVHLPLVVDSGLEPGGARLIRHDEGNVPAVVGAWLVRPQRSVDGVVHVEVHVGLAPAGARVPVQIAASALEARHRGRVEDVGAELRGEPAREVLLERPAIVVAEDPLPRRHVVRAVAHHAVIGHANLGTARRSVQYAIRRVEHVAHKQDPFAVGVPGSEDAAARARVAEVEPAFDLLAHEIAVRMELPVVVEEVPRVGPQLELVVYLGRAPDLHGRANVGIARLDEFERVRALRAAIRGMGVAVLAGEVQEAGLAERQSDVARERVHLAVPRDAAVFEALAGLAEEVPTGLEGDRAAGPGALQHEVHDARDRVGSRIGRTRRRAAPRLVQAPVRG